MESNISVLLDEASMNPLFAFYTIVVKMLVNIAEL